MAAPPPPSQFSEAQVPSVIPAGIPPGLEYLIPTNQVIVHEIKEFGLFANTYKQYNILDCFGRRMYYAAENASLSASCGSSIRSWTIDIFNALGQPVLTGTRTGGGGCDSNQCYVNNTPTGMNLGGIVEQSSCGTNEWNIVDGAGTPVLFLDAPFLRGGFGSREFPIKTMQEPRQEIGQIKKAFSGFFAREDVFGVEFPINLDEKTKAVLIYAAFLIDFQYYEGDKH